MKSKEDLALSAAVGFVLYKTLYRGEDSGKKIDLKQRQLESRLKETSPEFAGNVRAAVKRLEAMGGGEPLASIGESAL